MNSKPTCIETLSASKIVSQEKKLLAVDYENLCYAPLHSLHFQMLT